MPLSQLTFTASINWSLYKVNSGFGNTKQGPSSESFSLANISTTTFNQLYGADISLAASASQTINCASLTNLVGESFGFGHLLMLWVYASGSECTVSPGASNALEPYGAGNSVIVPSGGINIQSYPATATGLVVNSGAKNLLLTNTGLTALTVTVVILGSTI